MNLRKQFAEDGFAFPFVAFLECEANSLLKAYEATALIASRDLVLASLHTVLKPHLIWLWADAIANHPPILDVVEEVLGPDILIWSMDIFRREPSRGADLHKCPDRSDQIAPIGLDWHQDSLYLGLHPNDEVVRVWLALTSTMPENGTMRYLRGSHRLGTCPHLPADSATGFLRGPRVLAEIDHEAIVPVCLNPGCFSMHDIRIIHDSGANMTDASRVAVSITYISARVKPSVRCSAMPVRGCEGGLAFDRETRPVRDLAPQAVNGFVQALRARIEHMRAEGVPDILNISDHP